MFRRCIILASVILGCVSMGEHYIITSEQEINTAYTLLIIECRARILTPSSRPRGMIENHCACAEYTNRECRVAG